jgi:hypothetical protein
MASVQSYALISGCACVAGSHTTTCGHHESLRSGSAPHSGAGCVCPVIPAHMLCTVSQNLIRNTSRRQLQAIWHLVLSCSGCFFELALPRSCTVCGTAGACVAASADGGKMKKYDDSYDREKPEKECHRPHPWSYKCAIDHRKTRALLCLPCCPAQNEQSTFDLPCDRQPASALPRSADHIISTRICHIVELSESLLPVKNIWVPDMQEQRRLHRDDVQQRLRGQG